MIRASRLGIVHGALALFAAALVVRAAQVQLWDGARWAARAARQHYGVSSVPALRGDILDATGMPLAVSREMIQLKVAPREVRDARALAHALTAIGVPRAWVARSVDARRAWVELPGRYLRSDVARLVSMKGVHPTPVAERVAAAGEGARQIVGGVTPNQAAIDGIELALDSVIRGERGTATVLRDARGGSWDPPVVHDVAARRGGTVVLTINYALQGICERALSDAVSGLKAEGGDIVVLDPRDGAVLAMASRRADRRATASTALTEPFEPGSTVKPFIAAALLSRRRARPDEVVDTHDGVMALNGRTIHDAEPAARMTLAEVIAKSSNIGIVQFAARLSTGEEYQALRDVGFGTPTGVPYPVEAAGTLREPKSWSRQSPASLAMGYELSVTPLQLAAAYAAIANGGELLEPALVKEVRAADGTARFRHQRRVVRRVMSPDVARTIRGMLAQTVDSGTGLQADLATFDVGGKTGTARRAVGGRYADRQYTASFVGLFPLEAPQYVILVKLDNPSGAYYGGKTAAPVSRAVLQAAIAARDAALDRGALAARERPPATLARDTPANVGPGRAASARRGGPTIVTAQAIRETARATSPAAAPLADVTTRAVLVDLARPPREPPAATTPRAVPDVEGMSLRNAVRVLHGAGFRVQLALDRNDSGSAAGTQPTRGTFARPGTVVRLLHQ